MRNPSIPPDAKPFFPTDPFEAWLARQALHGHSRHWLARNSVTLRERWRKNPDADLPPPLEPTPPPVPDRYSEI